MTKCTLLLGSLLKQKRGAAFWTDLEHRFIPIDAIAIGIRAAAIKYFAALRLFDYQLSFASRPGAGNAGRLLLDVLTLWII